MNKILYISLSSIFFYAYSAQNPAGEPENKEKLQEKLNQIKRQFSSSFLAGENLDLIDGRLSPRNSPQNSLSNSANLTPSGSSGKLLKNKS